MTSPTFLLILLILSVLHLTVYGRGFKKSVAEIPNPLTDPLACGRVGVAHSAICDPDRYLKKDKQDEIEGYINALSSVQVAVVVIKQMDLYSVSTVDIDLAAQRFAQGLHDRYGVGDKETNNGILVFLSIDDRAVYISTGKGVEDKLNHDMIQLIISNMKPELRQSKYGDAVATCITNIDVLLSGDGESMIEKAYKHKLHHQPSMHAPSPEEEGSDVVAWLLIAVFVGVISFLMWKGAQDRRNLESYDRGRTKLETLLREMEASQDPRNKFEVKTCPICLEEFEDMTANSTKANELRCSLAGDLASSSNPPTIPTSPGSSSNAIASDAALHIHRARARTLSETGDELPQPPGINIIQSKTVTLRCGHVFCIPCMDAYLKSERSNRCPICRKSLTGDDDTAAGGQNSGAQRPTGGGGDAQPRLRRSSGTHMGSASSFQQPTDHRPSSSSPRPTTASSSTPSGGYFSSFGRRTVHPYNYDSDVDSSGFTTNANGGGTYTMTETTTTSTTTTTTTQTSTGTGPVAPNPGDANPMHQAQDGFYDPHHNYHPFSSMYGSSRRFGYYAPEWRFRLHRMHYLYPSVVDYEFLRIANGAINRGSMHDLRSQMTERGVQVQRLATELRHRMEQAARSSGSHGSSRSSFGGGRSRGGGGGRW